MNTIPDRKELSNIRNYFYEIVFLLLISCVSFLFFDNRDIRRENNRYLYEDRAKMLEMIEKSSHAIEQNTMILQRNFTEK